VIKPGEIMSYESFARAAAHDPNLDTRAGEWPGTPKLPPEPPKVTRRTVSIPDRGRPCHDARLGDTTAKGTGSGGGALEYCGLGELGMGTGEGERGGTG